jgi:hypothetical protein
MEGCRLPGWKDCMDGMIKDLGIFKSDQSDPMGHEGNSYVIKDIKNTLRLLEGRARLFVEMVVDGGAQVSGALHCEASLASLIALPRGAFDDKYNTLIEVLEVTYEIVF